MAIPITKVIVPAAGRGTRFLPYTKAIPKEMLPLINKPAIQYVIEEALASDLAHFFFITGKNKDAIANHIDSSYELESHLSENNLEEKLACVNTIHRKGNFTYIRQSDPQGLGHAILQAQHCIGKEQIAIALPDHICTSPQPALQQLLRAARQEKANIIAVQEVPSDCVSDHGVISIKKQISPNLFQVSSIVNKPKAKDAPSRLAVMGRFVLSHKIFSSLDYLNTYASDQVLLNDGLTHMIQKHERVFAVKLPGTCYNLSTPLGWLTANVNLAMQNPVYAQALKKVINEQEDTNNPLFFSPAKTIEHTLM